MNLGRTSSGVAGENKWIRIQLVIGMALAERLRVNQSTDQEIESQRDGDM